MYRIDRSHVSQPYHPHGERMKVLFFIRSMVVGGSQRQLAMLARGLAARGHDVAVVVFYSCSCAS
jgi:hypothetical protein